MNLKKIRKSKTLLFSVLCIVMGVMAFVIFVVASISEGAFDCDIQGESLMFSILALIIGNEALLLEKPKIPCLSTAWISILVVLLSRIKGSFCGIDLTLSPAIFWGSIIALVIIGGVLINCLARKEK